MVDGSQCVTAPALDALILLATQAVIFPIVEKSRLTGSSRGAYASAFHSASGAIALHQSQADRVLGKFGDDLGQIVVSTGFSYKQVWSWRNRGFIPQEHHQRLLNRAAEIQADLLPHDFSAHLYRPAPALEKQSAAG